MPGSSIIPKHGVPVHYSVSGSGTYTVAAGKRLHIVQVLLTGWSNSTTAGGTINLLTNTSGGNIHVVAVNIQNVVGAVGSASVFVGDVVVTAGKTVSATASTDYNITAATFYGWLEDA